MSGDLEGSSLSLLDESLDAEQIATQTTSAVAVCVQPPPVWALGFEPQDVRCQHCAQTMTTRVSYGNSNHFDGNVNCECWWRAVYCLSVCRYNLYS